MAMHVPIQATDVAFDGTIIKKMSCKHVVPLQTCSRENIVNVRGMVSSVLGHFGPFGVPK